MGFKIEPIISEVKKELDCSGLKARVRMKDVYRVVPGLLGAYKKMCARGMNMNIKRPWQYISLSTNYSGTMEWDYYTGHVVESFEGEPEGLTHFTIPTGRYALFKFRDVGSMFMAMRIARIKKEIYTAWLPASGFKFSGIEFEYNEENMNARNPYDFNLYVGIE